MATKPAFVDIDPEKVLLAEKTPEKKTEDELIFQFMNTKSLVNRLESARELAESTNPAVAGLYQTGLQDDFWVIRLISMGGIAPTEANIKIIETLAEKDPHSEVRKQAIMLLSSTGDKKYTDLLTNTMKNARAYSVQAAALAGLKNIDPVAALTAAKNLENSENSDILSSVAQIYVESGDAQYLPFFEKELEGVDGYSAIGFYESYGKLVIQGDKETLIKGAAKMNAIGGDMKTSPFRRFAAVKTLNDFYLAVHDGSVESNDDAEKEALTKLKTQFSDMIKAIKEIETEPQLKTFYSAFPTPTN